MSNILGEFLTEIPETEEYLTISFSPSYNARKQRWGNYGLSADFLGDYFAAFFPGGELTDSQIDQKENIKASVSYLANELLENAVKFSDENYQIPVNISLFFYRDKMTFVVSNSTTDQIAEKYQEFIQKILNSDIDELYMQQLERTALGAGGSQMGLLTLINDYSARFGWKFETISGVAGAIKVTVMAHLDM